jgi:hypothetical protein
MVSPDKTGQKQAATSFKPGRSGNPDGSLYDWPMNESPSEFAVAVLASVWNE